MTHVGRYHEYIEGAQYMREIIWFMSESSLLRANQLILITPLC